MSSTNTNLLLPEITRRLVDRFHPERIILFGSHARGDAGPDSDVDLLVLVNHGEDTGDRTAAMYQAMSGLAAAIDIVVMSVQEFERHKDIIGTLARPASREGKVLYQRAA